MLHIDTTILGSTLNQLQTKPFAVTCENMTYLLCSKVTAMHLQQWWELWTSYSGISKISWSILIASSLPTTPMRDISKLSVQSLRWQKITCYGSTQMSIRSGLPECKSWEIFQQIKVLRQILIRFTPFWHVQQQEMTDNCKASLAWPTTSGNFAHNWLVWQNTYHNYKELLSTGNGQICMMFDLKRSKPLSCPTRYSNQWFHTLDKWFTLFVTYQIHKLQHRLARNRMMAWYVLTGSTVENWVTYKWSMDSLRRNYLP